MQSSKPRRVHGPELKKAVLAQCREPGASVSAVALAHGLNANLVRKWLVGRGLDRAGLAGCAARPSPHAEAMVPRAAPPMRFVPVALGDTDAAVAAVDVAPRAASDIHVELRRGNAQLTVRWPSSRAEACAAWLGQLAAVALK